MELSVVVARILSLTYLAAGVGALRGQISFRKMLHEFEQSPGLTYLSGFIALIVGMILVTYHNRWVSDWPVLITVVGWLSLVKGVLLIAAPQFLTSFKGWYKNAQRWGAAMVALGLLFGYFGFLS